MLARIADEFLQVDTPAVPVQGPLQANRVHEVSKRKRLELNGTQTCNVLFQQSGPDGRELKGK